MIALIDCNNFYASCEKVFNPTLAGRALIVLSNNDGCAIARSEEAKALGIQMAQPAFMAGELIRQHRVAVHSSNYALYGDMSERIMQVIKEFVPRAEVYSIDEIFADLSGMIFTDPVELAARIRERVRTCTGIQVSVGIGPTKALAKMANRYAKKTRPDEGVFVADTEERIQCLLASTPVGDIWGIGKQYAGMLKRAGFHSALDLVTRAPEPWIKERMSVVGQRLYHELKGIPCLPFQEEVAPRKNICTSRSFGKLITSRKEVQEAVAKFTSSGAAKLRKEGTAARQIQVFIQTNPHRPTDEQYFQSVTLRLPVASNLTTELIKHSMKGLAMIFQPGYKYQKAGVFLMDLIPESQVQLGLFDTCKRERDKKLMETIDGVNRAFGADKVRYGVQDYGKNWALKQGHLSPSYTTRLEQIPKVS